MSRKEIVVELLTHTTEMVNIDLVLMDREFQNDGVKTARERNDIHYLNPSGM
jgi:IS4 transposase